MSSEKMFALADQLRELREGKREAEQLVKQLNEQIDDTDYRLSELMAETETQNFTRAGTMFYLTTKTRASAVAGNKEELHAALKAHGFGDLVYETVNANSLSAFVKEQMEETAEDSDYEGAGTEDTLPDWLNGLVNVFDKTTVGVKKASK